MAALEPDQLPIISMADAARAHFTTHVVTADQVFAVRNGRPINARLALDDSNGSAPVAVFTPDDELVGLYEQHGPVAKAVAIFAPA